MHVCNVKLLPTLWSENFRLTAISLVTVCSTKTCVTLCPWTHSVFSCYCCSVPKSCLTLCHSMNCSTPGFPVFCCFLDFVQTPVHWVQWCCPTISSFVFPFSFCLQSFPVLASVIPMNIQGWFPLGLTGLIFLQSKRLQECSLKPQFIRSSVLSLLYGPSLISIHDFWKNHTFDYMTK